ncbi:MAG TPA: DeoR/GlpR family DNA-binding transcription regulator [Bryobacteraceae bacterium]|jgi:DeoR/GlpR family transcriptional regulator of sugar metabolism|nr:DeoR/GlpR family DNA-binding transcription regulator [Bryobacteraceae bacterium]
MYRSKPNRLLAEERRREILGVLEENGRITIDEVVTRFGVSAVTARSDLDALSESGDLVRSHGGGIKPLIAAPEHPLKVRENMNPEAKARIAQAAARLIRPLQTVILCSGSTSAELARQIRRNPPENITIITYALNVAATLSEIPNVSLVMLGGFLRHPSTAFVGPHAEQMMHSLHADHCFMSTVGLDADVGLTTLDIMEAQLNRRMIESAAQVTVLADSSKFGHRSLSLITDFRAIQRVITDVNAPVADVEKLRARSIDVVLV